MSNSPKIIVSIPMVMTTKGPVYKGQPLPDLSTVEKNSIVKQGAGVFEKAAPVMVKPVIIPPTPTIPEAKAPQKEEEEQGEKLACKYCGKDNFASIAGLKAHERHCKNKQSK